MLNSAPPLHALRIRHARARAWSRSLAAASSPGAAAAASPTLDRIKATGTITFGYRDGAAPFSARQRNGQVRGYSVELCEKVAAAVGRALGIADLKVVWKPVDSETRITDVVARKIDAECGTTTITLSRMERVDFSVPIFVDGGSALVRAGKDAPTSVAALAGKRIAVMPATTTETRAAQGARRWRARTPRIVHGEGRRRRRGGAARRQGRRLRVRPHAARAAAAQRRARRGELAFLENDFSFEPYGIVLPRDDPDFRLLVNRTLVALYKSRRDRSDLHPLAGAVRQSGRAAERDVLSQFASRSDDHARPARCPVVPAARRRRGARRRARRAPRSATASAASIQRSRRSPSARCGRRSARSRPARSASSGVSGMSGHIDADAVRARVHATRALVVIGAAGGAVYAQKPNEYRRTRWDVTLKMDDGTTRVVSIAYRAAVRAGGRLRARRGQQHRARQSLRLASRASERTAALRASRDAPDGGAACSRCPGRLVADTIPDVWRDALARRARRR